MGEGRDDGIQHPLHLLRPGLGLSPCVIKAVAAAAAPCCAVSRSVLHNVASASKEGPSSAWLTPGSRPATAWSPCSPPACSSARPSANRDPQITLKVSGMGGFQPRPCCDSLVLPLPGTAAGPGHRGARAACRGLVKGPPGTPRPPGSCNSASFCCPSRVQGCEQGGLLPARPEVQVLQPDLLPTDVL